MRGLIHHIDLTVRDIAVSAPFYETVLSFIGYKRGREQADGIDWDRDLPGFFCGIGIKPARHDLRSAGRLSAVRQGLPRGVFLPIRTD